MKQLENTSNEDEKCISLMQEYIDSDKLFDDPAAFTDVFTQQDHELFN